MGINIWEFRNRLLGIVSVLGVVSISWGAFADATPGPGNGNIYISATVPESCNIISTQDVSVNYDPFYKAASNYIRTSRMEFNCNQGTQYTITISGYTGKLQNIENTSEYLHYTLIPTYVQGTDFNGTQYSEFLTFTIYIPTGQNVSVGTYKETVNVNISFQ